ncbi:MAG TPA: hypothetical protein PLB73_09535, partial [Leptospiraceae bacterium]|nr:hypothetical protein [Leptospiraceae bacterium]
YEACIQELQPFRSAPYPDATRARALLYTGISYYKLGQYRTARRYFIDPVVRKELPDRSTFWNKRSLERLP